VQAVGKGGVVRDEASRQAAIARVRGFIEAQDGWSVTGIVPSPIAGGSGNQEFLLGAVYGI
jgi:23S rRNA (cytidine1920-2'-O)/16S rRNA (cytidine1409-2'-O)-methyltransferase